MRNALYYNKCDWERAKMQIVFDQQWFTFRLPDCFHTAIHSGVWHFLNQYFVLFSSLKILKQYTFK